MNTKILLATTAFLTALAVSGAQSAPLFHVSESETRDLIRDAVEKEKRAPGIAVGIIDETGSHVITYGTLKRGSTNQIDGDTIFEIGSITKVFTTLLLQDMVENGEVKMDDPIGKFLPESVKTPTRNGRQITLYHLATHTSGLPRLPFGSWHAVWHMDDPYATFTLKDFYKFLSHYELTNDIGANFEYSNAGMSLLGHCLELNAHTNYESLVVQRICKPLSMDSTCVHLSPELKKSAATGHMDGKPTKGWSPSDFPADGELRSSLNDMLKFLSANLGLTPSPLSKQMQATQLPQQKTDDPAEQVGLGWSIKRDSGVVWHNGETLGFASYIAFSPIEHRGVVILANTSENDVDDLGDILIGVRKLRKEVNLDAAIFARYLGKYEFGPKKVMSVFRRGERMFVQVTGQQKFEIFPESETEFFLKDLDGQATFVTNDVGTTTALIWYQDGIKRGEKKKMK